MPHTHAVLVRGSGDVAIVDREGRVAREGLRLDDPTLATALTEALLAPPAGASSEERWYEQTWVWIVGGAIIAGGATAAVLAASSGGDETVRLVIGR